MLVGRERIELPETYVAGFTDRPAAFYGISAHVGTPTANRTLIHGLEDRCTLRCAIGAYGVRGGSRTRKTCILSAVPVPIRLHGQIGLPSGFRTRSPRFLRAVRIPIPTPGEMVSLPGFEPGVRRL